MNRIHVLDCTLRDGGYCNQWNFGYENIKKIMESLVKADIDIIECGFLTKNAGNDRNISRYRKIEDVLEYIPELNKGKIFCVMINCGEYEIEELPDYPGKGVQGIRIAFHKKDRKKAFQLACEIKKKGYLVFLQPMVSVSYTDEEFLDLILRTNEIVPYAFYIVDSFGMMKKKSLMRFFYMIEHNLDEKIMIGFHSHNNIQLAYSNAQSLVETLTNRDLIIDSSIYGMGRGAGNLNTELFVDYLNENIGAKYQLEPLLNAIDEVLNEFYQRNYWGYSLPNYLSAIHNVHPNYAFYLDDKKTLTLENMNRLFLLMDREKRLEFDKDYIADFYRSYMAMGNVQEEHYDELKNELEGRTVLLIFPGKSAMEEHEKVVECAMQDGIISMSVNFDYPYYDSDYMFFGNQRRIRGLNQGKKKKCIVTSNISIEDVFLQTDYSKLLNEEEYVTDNAGMMAIKFLIEIGIKKIWLAGLDGYSHDIDDNYAGGEVSIVVKSTVGDAINSGLQKVILQYAKLVDMQFLTKQRYIKL